MSEIVYKIRRKSDGLYSTGGTSFHFNKKGKVWKGDGPLKLHIGMLIQHRDSEYALLEEYEDCEVVELEMKEVEGESSPVSDWANLILDRRMKKDEEYKRAEEEKKAAYRKAKYEELKKEFE